jgi:uncharacterized protein YbaR (Trm112 family)
MITDRLLEILCCPETHQKLRWADAQLLDQLNRRIAAGQVRNRAGQPVRQPLEAGLVRHDGQVLYPVWSGLPRLLIDEAIPLTGLGDLSSGP